MRLSHVTQLALPRGRLRSVGFDVSVSGAAEGAGEALPISFDQRRHVGEGERPGSWIGVTLHLVGPVDADLLAAAWALVVARHGALRSRFTGSPTDLALQAVRLGPPRWQEHPAPADRPMSESLRAVLDATCTPFADLSHRLCLIEPPTPGEAPFVVLASDHAHVDMWSLVVLARDLLTCLEDLVAGRHPPGADLPAVRPFAEHTAELAARPTAPRAVHERWRDLIERSGGAMPIFPLPLGDLSQPQPERVLVRDVLDAAGLARLSQLAHARGGRTLALVVSVMTEVTRELTGGPLRAVFPVHSRHDPGWHDAVGWFITNAVLESLDPDLAACTAAVAESVRLGSWPLADVLAPWGGMPSGPGMFALSWLDVRRLRATLPPVREVWAVSPAIRTDGVMIWFVLNDAGLHLRCRCPDTPTARAAVDHWLDAVLTRLHALAN